MDLTFTYEDGSEAIIHYGVKGMKWGVTHAPYKTDDGTYISRKSSKLITKTAKYRKKRSEAAARGKTNRALKLERKQDKTFTRLYDNVALDNPKKYAKSEGFGPAIREATHINKKADSIGYIGVGVFSGAAPIMKISPAAAVAVGAVGLGTVAAASVYKSIKSKRVNEYLSYARRDVNVHTKND